MSNFFSSKTSSSGVERCLDWGEGKAPGSQLHESSVYGAHQTKMMVQLKETHPAEYEYYSNTMPSDNSKRENIKRTKASLGHCT